MLLSRYMSNRSLESFCSIIAQAEGMVSAQADVSLAKAAFLLDMYSAWHDQSLRHVATQVVDRSLRFKPSDGNG